MQQGQFNTAAVTCWSHLTDVLFLASQSMRKESVNDGQEGLKHQSYPLQLFLAPT
jgi:hypothetical protein